MTLDVLNAFLALYAASSGVSLAYLSLPDYRYRNSITEYFQYHLERSIRLHEKFKNKEVELEAVRAMIAREKKRQCDIETVNTKSDSMKIEPWIRFLEDLLEMPKGHVPNKDMLITEDDRVKHRTNKVNWFLTPPGWCFRNIYLLHRDNSVVTILAGLSLTLLSVIISLIIFSVKIPVISYDHVTTGIWATLTIFFLIPLVLRVYRKQYSSNGIIIYAGFSILFAVLTYVSTLSTTAVAPLATAVAPLTTAVAPQTIVAQSGVLLLASVLLSIGLLALVAPAILALLGRRFICETVRTAIHHAVDSLLTAELNDEVSDWLKTVADATKDVSTPDTPAAIHDPGHGTN